jgi:rhamnulokinase
VAARTFAAVDIGGSGGRVIAGSVDRDGVTLHEAHRFANEPVQLDGHLRWNFEELHRQVLAGLDRVHDAESIGVTTWGVDYGLLDDGGELLGPPICYRDERTAEAIERVHGLLAPEELYRSNGVQFLPFNTLYQLAAEQHGPLWSAAAHVVLIPDLLAHRLTGELRTEVTNASTTGLLDPRTHQWSARLLDLLGIPARMLPPLDAPGDLRGSTPAGVPVVTVASHDTASAVAAVPSATDNFAFIASGTWSLVGMELARPVLSPQAATANFTNELGVEGRTRFLRNHNGLWLVQQCMAAWQRGDIDELLAEAGEVRDGPRIDVDDPALLAPAGMPARIAAAAGRELSAGATVRCILDSLADAYARTIDELVSLTRKPIDVIHVVGGGSQNGLLCQLTADATRRPVLAGPVEATAVGNVLVQAQARGAAPPSLGALRRLVANSFDVKTYEPT